MGFYNVFSEVLDQNIIVFKESSREEVGGVKVIEVLYHSIHQTYVLGTDR